MGTGKNKSEQVTRRPKVFTRREFIKGLGLGAGLVLVDRIAKAFTGRNKSQTVETTYHGDPAPPPATPKVNTEGSPALKPEPISLKELDAMVKWALMYLKQEADQADSDELTHLVSAVEPILTSSLAASFQLNDGRVYSRNRILSGTSDQNGDGSQKRIEYKIYLCANQAIKQQTILEIHSSFEGTIPTKDEENDDLPGLQFDNLSIVLSAEGLRCYSFDSDYPHEFKSSDKTNALVGKVADDLLSGEEKPLQKEIITDLTHTTTPK